MKGRVILLETALRHNLGKYVVHILIVSEQSAVAAKECWAEGWGLHTTAASKAANVYSFVEKTKHLCAE